MARQDRVLPGRNADSGAPMADTAPNAHPNVWSSRYFIVESRMRCDQCNVVTAVFGLALPADYESLYVDDDAPDDESRTGESPRFVAVLSYVGSLPETVAHRIRSVTPHYRLDVASEAGGT